jgi:hypothetical protein
MLNSVTILDRRLRIEVVETLSKCQLLPHLAISKVSLGDRLYRNNLSFIKAFAPEIGRGVRLTYTVRFF